MIIDTHQHVFWHGRDDAGLVADMDEHGIDVAWLLTWEIAPWENSNHWYRALNPLNVRADGTHAGITLGDLIKTRDRYPDRFIVGYCPHPMIGDAAAMLESAVKIHGVRLCAEWKFRIPFDDPRSIELFRKAGELSCPVVLHLDIPWMKDAQGAWQYQPGWYGGTVANLARAMDACPDTVFIGHAPGFWREISGDADDAASAYPDGPVTPGGKLNDLFERYPNLYADLSAGSGMRALSRDTEHAVKFIERWQDRLFFARDIYGQDLHAFLTTLDLPAAIHDKLYYQNAMKLIPCGDVNPKFA